MSDDIRLDLLRDAICRSDLDGQTKEAFPPVAGRRGAEAHPCKRYRWACPARHPAGRAAAV